MPKKKSSKQPVKLIYNFFIFALAIIVVGFLYSFVQKNMSNGVAIQDPQLNDRQKEQLAIEIYKANPVLDIKVEILNGCGENDIAAKAAEFLRSEHIDVIRWENAENFDYENTILIHHSDDLINLKTVAKSLDININDGDRVLIQPNSSSDVDITLLLGKDYHTIKPIRIYLANLR